MPKIALLVLGGLVLVLTMTASPFDGNVLGFCPISEGPKAVAVDAAVAAIDAFALWLVYRGIRA